MRRVLRRFFCRLLEVIFGLGTAVALERVATRLERAPLLRDAVPPRARVGHRQHVHHRLGQAEEHEHGEYCTKKLVYRIEFEL